jgi:hypothetical protein
MMGREKREATRCWHARFDWAAMAYFAAATLAAYGQSVTVRTQNSVAALEAPAVMLREIDDPHSGARWLLLPNPNHPGGPGRLVLAAGGDRTGSAAVAIAVPARPVIRAGDELVVEENTVVVEARLEARALGSASLGNTLHARLKMGGKVVPVVALGPGRAALEPEMGGRP